jgi:hypothetical protein
MLHRTTYPWQAQFAPFCFVYGATWSYINSPQVSWFDQQFDSLCVSGLVAALFGITVPHINCSTSFRSLVVWFTSDPWFCGRSLHAVTWLSHFGRLHHLFIFIEVMFPGVSCIDHRCSLQNHRCLGHQRPTVSSVLHRDRCWSRAMPPSSLGWRPAQISSGARDENGWIRFFMVVPDGDFLWWCGVTGVTSTLANLQYSECMFGFWKVKTNPKAELKMILQFNMEG